MSLPFGKLSLNRFPAIVGMAKAFEIAERDRESETARLQQLRDRLIGGVLEAIDGATLTGAPDQRVCNIASFIIPTVEAEGMLIALDMAGIAASSGSACTSASQKPSHVLEAIGVAKENLAGGLRFSLGRSTTVADVEKVIGLAGTEVGWTLGGGSCIDRKSVV